MKKVLSFVLILALVLSSFSMAFAGSSTELKNLSDVSGNTNEEAIEVAYDLGIVTGNPDGTFQPAKAVTRAEFAAMLTRALAIPQSALAGYANANFKDTNGYAWAVPYLAFCNSKGIMLGDGAGNAMPGKTITVNESVTMALRAIGYTANSSELTGVWPSNYVTKAQELKLYDDVAKDATGVDKANAAQVIYNLLGVQKVAVNSDGKTEKLWDKSPASNGTGGVETTLLSAGLNCTTTGNKVVQRNDCNDALINMAKHIGKYGSIYRNSNHEVVAFIAEDNSALLTGRFFKDGDSIKFKATDTEKEYTIESSKSTSVPAVLLNGDNVGGDNTLTIGGIKFNSTVAMDFTQKSTTYPELTVSVDLNGSTIRQIYGVNKWDVSSGDKIDASDIKDIKDDKSLLSTDFKLDDNDNIDYTQFQLVGVNSLNDLKADNVVYVYKDSDKKIVRVDVGTQVASGVVKNYKTAKDDVATKFAIGANTYKNASEVENGSVDGGTAVEDDDVSDDIKAYLDARGFVYDYDNSAKATNYAVVERASNSGNVDDQVKVMLADGTEKTLSYDKSDKDCGTLSAVSVIGYGLDSQGKITDANKQYITAQFIKLSSKNVISTVTNPAVAADSRITTGAPILSTTGAGIASKGAKIASDCVVFTVDSDGDYDVTTIDKVEVDKVITNAVLLFDEENGKTINSDYKVVAMLVPADMAKGGDKSYAVLNEKNGDSNADNDKVWHIIGFKDGAKLDALTDDKSSFGGSSSKYVAPDYDKTTGFNSGVALYEVKVDAKGVVTDGKEVTTTYKSDVYSAGDFTVSKADDRKSFIDSTGARHALSDKVVIYQVGDNNEYKTYDGKLKAGDFVRLYETNDDNDGYDFVIMARPSEF